MTSILTEAEFEQFRNLIYNESGIHFSASNRAILESRLRERLRATPSDTIADYYRRIRSDGEELKVLLDAVTTNLTRFFRNTAHFETFENYVIPTLVEKRRTSMSTPIKVWSAGCSTGEEPYSVAMVLKEKLPPGMRAEVVGSDISLKSLMIGREGFYPKPRVQGVPDVYLKKYFEPKGDGYQVTQEIRSMIRFDYHNLKHDSGLRNLDIVFCRNVLIYFDAPAQKAAVDLFWQSMSSGSFLFIGHSESLFGMDTQFEFVRTDWACIYRKN
jgi:chemotaxis protein methyltransferase CheR